MDFKDIDNKDFETKPKEKRIIYRGTDVNGNTWRGQAASYKKQTLPEEVSEISYITPTGRMSTLSKVHEDSQPIEVISCSTKDGKEFVRMKDTFNLKKFKKALSEGVVKFRFKKISGEQEQRVIWATTNLDIIKANGYIFKGAKRKVRNDIIVFWSMIDAGWRCCYSDKINQIFEFRNYNKFD